MNPLQRKRYRKPPGNQAFNSADFPHVISVGELIPMENFVTFVVPQDKVNYVPEPSYSYFGVGDPRVFSPGDTVFVDLVNGESDYRVVRKKTGRVLWLDQPLNHLPKVMGEVFKIVGQKSVLIDSRFTDKENRPDPKPGVQRRLNNG